MHRFVRIAVAAALCGVSFAERINLQFRVGFPEVLLPAAEGSNDFRLVEWSTNLTDWDPVARDYGTNWEGVFPYALAVASNDVLQDPEALTRKYYRFTAISGSGLSNSNSVSRFLQQSTFGPTRGLISAFAGIDDPTLNDPPYTHYAAWIDAQMALPISSLRAFWRERSNPAFTNNPANAQCFEVGYNPAYGQQLTYYTYDTEQVQHVADTNDAVAAGRNANDVTFAAAHTRKLAWYQLALTAPDALRQKTAWALSQIFVVSENGSSQLQATERWLTYYDIFVRNAFGNFRDLLGEVTYSPHMGYYLTFVDNKAFSVNGTYPDENYAREVMQLFTIGLWMLNQDGTLILDGAGKPIPTYDNEDIKTFARAFTGLRRPNARENIEMLYANDNHIDPMRVQASWHDFDSKILLDDSTLGPFTADEAGARADIDGLLDHLFNHPNVPPFIARRLIQRFTVSNPSPRYIYDVAQAFIDGMYQGVGSGQRGDLAATIRAVLLHPEARVATLSNDAAHGRLREPLIRLLSVARAFEITSLQTYGLFPFDKMDQELSQAPFQSPSVFSFYQPDYQPAGEILDRDVYAPEFQIHNDITSLSLPNAVRTLVYDGIDHPIGYRWYSQGELDLSFEIALAADTDALLDHLNLMLTAGRLTDWNRGLIAPVIDSMPAGSEAEREARVQRAISLFALLPEFNVLW